MKVTFADLMSKYEVVISDIKLTFADLMSKYERILHEDKPMPIPFIGRENELKRLAKLLKKKVANLVVVMGCRRIGKTRLIKELAKKYELFC